MGVRSAVASGQGGQSPVRAFGSAPLTVYCGTFTFSNSYLQGGEAMSLSDLFRAVHGVLFESVGTYTFRYVSGMVIAYGAAAGAQPADATNLSLLGPISFIAVGAV